MTENQINHYTGILLINYDKYSLESDTAVFFLTANPVSSNNFRLVSTPNNVAGNSLPVEPYFMYTLGNYPRQKMNPGMA